MSYHILFEGGCFALSYSTHIWNACCRKFIKNKETRKMKHAYNKGITRLIIVLCPKLAEILPLISAKYAAPTPHRERGKDS